MHLKDLIILTVKSNYILYLIALHLLDQICQHIKGDLIFTKFE